MTKNNAEKMVEIRRLLVFFLVFSFVISSVSAFCFVQGYVKNEQGNLISAETINIVCKTSEGDKIIQDSGEGYGHPFGGLDTDCSFCSGGVYVNAIDKQNELYGEVEDKNCNIERNNHCQNDVIIAEFEPTDGSDSGSGSAGGSEGAESISEVPYYDYVAPETNDANREASDDLTPGNLPGVPNPERDEMIKNIVIAVLAVAVIALLFWIIKLRTRSKK